MQNKKNILCFTFKLLKQIVAFCFAHNQKNQFNYPPFVSISHHTCCLYIEKSKKKYLINFLHKLLAVQNLTYEHFSKYIMCACLSYLPLCVYIHMLVYEWKCIYQSIWDNIDTISLYSNNCCRRQIYRYYYSSFIIQLTHTHTNNFSTNSI